MSGLWLLFILAVWGGVSWLLWRPARAYLADGPAPRRLRITVIALAASLWIGVSFWYAGGRKIYYDAEVNRLCRVDGGVKVYETVKLPAEKFDKYGVVSIPSKDKTMTGDDYHYELDRTYLRRGTPEVWRLHFQIVQKSDGKVLGEATTFARRGGDLPGLWHDSSFGCPGNADISDLKRQIFVSAK